MSNKLLFLIGIIGVTLFVVTSILGGFQFESYDPMSQYISESMATFIGGPAAAGYLISEDELDRVHIEIGAQLDILDGL